MRVALTAWGLLAAVLLCLSLAAIAGEHPTRLKVGVCELPPLAMKDPSGNWSGLAVDLWERVSARLDVPFDYVELPMDQILMKLNRGDLDLSLAELGVSAERERMVDFTQPFFATAAAVALPRESGFAEWRVVLDVLTSHGFFPVIAIMMGTLIIFSLILWVIERRVQRSHFGGKPIHGLGSAIWFSAVTMTTVGYGDKTPQTPLGRMLAFIWMFLGILLVSAFTGSVASSFTVAQLNTSVNRVSDLARYRNGVLEGSLAQNLLSGTGIPTTTFTSINDGLAALQRRTISAFAGDELTLRYLVQLNYPETLRVAVIPRTHITYAMATRPNFPEIDAMNVAILEILDSHDWQARVELWAGAAAYP